MVVVEGWRTGGNVADRAALFGRGDGGLIEGVRG